MADPTRSYLPKAYFRKQFVDYKNALIPISTAGFQYGIGCWGGIRGYKQADGSVKIFRLRDHAKRQAAAVKLLGLKIDITAEEIEAKITELFKLNKPQTDVYIRPIIYKSDTLLGPALRGEYDFAIYMLAIGEYLDTEKGLNVCISKIPRVADEAIPSKAKAIGIYINSAIAIDDATRNGYDGTIMLGSNGKVAEGAVMNLFIVRDNKLVTPSLDGDLLEGITRRSVIELAKDLGIDIEERVIEKNELFSANEVFFTGTATELAYIKSIDGKEISGQKGEVTRALADNFKQIVRGEHELSKTWLNTI